MQDKYDELDNIVRTLDELIDNISDEDYKNELRETKYRAEKEMEEVEERLRKEQKEEEEEQEREYYNSKF